MKRYIAIGGINWLGTRHDTREEAERAVLMKNAVLSSWTGYCSVFHEFAHLDDGEVFEYDDEKIITKEEFDKIMAEKKEAKKKLDEEIAQLRRKRMLKYWTLEAIYHNQVPYQGDDIIRITTRNSKTGRKKVSEGRVYESVINENGELRPALAQDKDRYTNPSHTIEKIEVLGNHRAIPNAHCRHYDHYVDGKAGQCTHYDRENDRCLMLEELLKKEEEE